MLKASAFLLGAAAVAAPLHAQSGIDTAGAGLLLAEAEERSQVMENLR